MENNNHKKRKVMLIAAFAVAIIALAGVGYAAVVGYKGTTVISENTASGKVILVTPDGGSYTERFGTVTDAEIKVNTYTDNTYKDSNTLYTIEGADEVIDTNIVGKQFGSNITFTIAKNITANYSLKVELVDFTAATGWSYYICIDGDYTDITDGDAEISITGKSTSGPTQTVTAGLFIASKAFQNAEFSGKAIGDSTELDGYTGYATAKGSPVDADGKFFEDLVVVFTFVTA